MKPAAALFAFVFLLVAIPATAAGPYAHLPHDLAQAAAEYDAAQVAGDGAALERLVADDFVLVAGGGVVQSKADLIRDYTAPGFKLDPFMIEEPFERVWNDGAVLGGRVDMQGTEGGRRFRVMVRFADVWARRDGKWRVVYAQVTRVPAPAN